MITFFTINTALLMAKLMTKPILKQKCHCLAKNKANKYAKS